MLATPSLGTGLGAAQPPTGYEHTTAVSSRQLSDFCSTPSWVPCMRFRLLLCLGLAAFLLSSLCLSESTLSGAGLMGTTSDSAQDAPQRAHVPSVICMSADTHARHWQIVGLFMQQCARLCQAGR